VKIAVVANSAWYIANFRLALMAALRERGHEVVAISANDDDVVRINAAGFRHRVIPLSGRGTRLLGELASLRALRRALREELADIALSYTPKGNIYTAFARRASTCRQIANVSGLGSSFIRQDWLTQLVRGLYRVAFRRVDHVFFQNEDDRRVFIDSGLIDAATSERIPGSGVDLRHFAFESLPVLTEGARPTFLMIARLLGDKGVREFVAAARTLRERYPKARCQLLGKLGADNPSAIAPRELADWIAGGDVEYLGYHVDVRPFISAATCVVLPSYREGVPRTLLEAAAMGRPLVATDVPGCRDTIDNGCNGWLCRARDVASLTEAMHRVVAMSDAQRAAMGVQSRRKMEAGFSDTIVVDRYLRVVEALAP
jgi:glycosyltransferase involved in cell wall biosynthesis